MAVQQRVAIIGAGPVGLEAALALSADGYDVRVYEQGQVGDHIRRWGHVTLFSPWKLNVSERGLLALDAQGLPRPAPETFPTGAEYVAQYLAPLARTLGERVVTGARVVAVGRGGTLKGELIGDPRRAALPFRLLLQDAAGDERVAEADVVIDAAGTYGQPNALGAAGIVAPGERAAAAAGRVEYHLPDVLGADRDRFAGRHTLVVGAGYSAATVLDALAQLAAEVPGTRVTWASREPGAPFQRIADDPLPERDRLAVLGNRTAAGDAPGVQHIGNVVVDALSAATDRTLSVTLQGPAGPISVSAVDRVLALVGYRPDLALYRELQVHQCYASEGPMKLAAALLGGGGDCLAQSTLGPETLTSPEPGFFLLGARSYGRRSDFLVKVGLAQVEEIRTLLGQSA